MRSAYLRKPDPIKMENTDRQRRYHLSVEERKKSFWMMPGLQECTIVASNSFDEYLIRDVIVQGACIDSFGVGERLITARSEPVFGGVYKMAGDRAITARSYQRSRSVRTPKR